MRNPYEILGITSSASDDEIKRAYRKMASEHSDDPMKMDEINEAYDTIILSRNSGGTDKNSYSHSVESEDGLGDIRAKLNAGRIDCIWNGMSVSPSRAEAMNLSEPYMKNSMVFVVPANSTAKTMDDLKTAKIGVQNGSTAQEILEGSAIGSTITMQAIATNVEALQQMDLGLVDAVFLDSVVAEYKITSESKEWVILPDGLEEEEYAIGFRKNDKELRDEVQKILGEMKKDGTVEKISTKWFGSDVTTIQ